MSRADHMGRVVQVIQVVREVQVSQVVRSFQLLE